MVGAVLGLNFCGPDRVTVSAFGGFARPVFGFALLFNLRSGVNEPT
jgi:hypothetical protein